MRKFNITVNGKAYEVEVEEVGRETSASSSTVSNKTVTTSKPAPAATKKPEAKAEPKAEISVSEGQEVLSAPMPGNIWKIVAKPGEEVKAGDVILILEAMKMENEILAPRDGVVSSIPVAEGTTVNTGQTLAIID